MHVEGKEAQEGQGLAVSKRGEQAVLEKGRQLQDTKLKHSCFLQRDYLMGD